MCTQVPRGGLIVDELGGKAIKGRDDSASIVRVIAFSPRRMRVACSWHADTDHEVWPFPMESVCIRHVWETLGTPPRPGWPIPDSCICPRCTKLSQLTYTHFTYSSDEVRTGNYQPDVYDRIRSQHYGEQFSAQSDDIRSWTPSSSNHPNDRRFYTDADRPTSAAPSMDDDDETSSHPPTRKSPKVVPTSSRTRTSESPRGTTIHTHRPAYQLTNFHN